MATTVNATLKHKRGTEASMPTLKDGQIYLCSDTHKVYKGISTGENILISDIAQLKEKVNKTDIVNNLTTTSPGSPLDATQGKILSDKLNNIKFFSAVVEPNGHNTVNIVLSDIKSSSVVVAINGDGAASGEYVIGVKVDDGVLVVYLNTARTGSMRISGIYSI